MPNLLDTLEALERQATPGPLIVGQRTSDGVWFVWQQHAAPGDIERHTTFCRRREDAEAHAAARNALPALLRVARAAQRYAELSDLPCDYEDLDEGQPCPGIERNGGPCHWCDLRAALAALDGGTPDA
jgi:hypothetical protein